MKTIQEIKKEISEITTMQKRKAGNNPEHRETSEYKKSQKQVDFLRDCQFYLEREATEEFTRKEQQRVKAILTKIDSGFIAFMKINNNISRIYNGDEQKCRQDYNKQNERNKHARHLKNLNYILS